MRAAQSGRPPYQAGHAVGPGIIATSREQRSEFRLFMIMDNNDHFHARRRPPPPARTTDRTEQQSVSVAAALLRGQAAAGGGRPPVPARRPRLRRLSNRTMPGYDRTDIHVSYGDTKRAAAIPRYATN